MPNRPIRIERTRELAVPVERVWSVLSDTNRVNRALGMPEVAYGTQTAEQTGLYRDVSIRWKKIEVAHWKEYPFEWTKNRSLSVLRDFQKGVLRLFRWTLELGATQEGSQVRVAIDFVPRYPVLNPLLRWAARRFIDRAFRYLELKTKDKPSAFKPTLSNTRVGNERFLRSVENSKALVDGGNAASRRLKRHLLEGDDTEMFHMRPFVLAEEWGVDRNELLSGFMRSTQEGMLQMSWELLCPNCRVSKKEYTSLSELSPEVHCELCGINFETQLDKYIELRFGLSPGLGLTSPGVYCIGSPNQTPHALAQVNLPARSSREVQVDCPSEDLRLRVLQLNADSMLTPGNQPKSLREPLTVIFNEGKWSSRENVFLPGRNTLRLMNKSDTPITVVLEDTAWASLAVTAAYVTALQEFRSLFALEVLPPGKQVGIQKLTLFFSDLKSSTEMYEKVGDASAFGRVQKHFDFMMAEIGKREGAVVKTIGDAVMAAFSDPAQALRAAIAIQNGIEKFCVESKIDPALILKIGLHCGPAISLNTDGVLDYFGRTVNIAARVQGESEGSDIVMSKAFLEESGVEEVLRGESREVARFQSELKGIDGAQVLYRLNYDEAVASKPKRVTSPVQSRRK